METKKDHWKGKAIIMKKIIPIILVLCFLSVNAYAIDETTFMKQLEQKIDKLKKNTPVLIKCWDGTELQVTFVENPKDQPDVILVRIWGKVLPMEKGLIEKIERR